ncbi:hypothetical protein HK096_003749 [Nowakowskiella sp. JEL0078]|nr:hypothetical protein HK096_003749 [Nowakowskiella sp. JEL0078]
MLLFHARHSGWFISLPVKEHDPIFMADLQMNQGLSSQSNKGIYVSVADLAIEFDEKFCEMSQACTDFSVLNIVKSVLKFQAVLDHIEKIKSIVKTLLTEKGKLLLQLFDSHVALMVILHHQNPTIAALDPLITTPITNPDLLIISPNPLITIPNPLVTIPNPLIPTPYPLIATPYPLIATPYPSIATPYSLIATPSSTQLAIVSFQESEVSSTSSAQISVSSCNSSMQLGKKKEKRGKDPSNFVEK